MVIQKEKDFVQVLNIEIYFIKIGTDYQKL